MSGTIGSPSRIIRHPSLGCAAADNLASPPSPVSLARAVLPSSFPPLFCPFHFFLSFLPPPPPSQSHTNPTGGGGRLCHPYAASLSLNIVVVVVLGWEHYHLFGWLIPKKWPPPTHSLSRWTAGCQGRGGAYDLHRHQESTAAFH